MNFKFFDNSYCLVLENDFKISQSLFQELDNIANVLMDARDQIIVSVQDPDQIKTFFDEIHQMKMLKLSYQMDKLKHIRSSITNPSRKLNETLIEMFDEGINTCEIELGRLETATALDLLKEWFVENEPNKFPGSEAEEMPVVAPGQEKVLKEEPCDVPSEAETEQNVDMANLKPVDESSKESALGVHESVPNKAPKALPVEEAVEFDKAHTRES